MIIFANTSCILCEIALGWVPVNLSQHWFKWYLGAIRQHAIILAIIDQYLSCYIYMWMENLFFLIMVEFSPIFSNFFMKYKFIIIFIKAIHFVNSLFPGNMFILKLWLKHISWSKIELFLGKWIQNCSLTLKRRETHGCVVSTVAIDALVLKHQAIIIQNAD